MNSTRRSLSFAPLGTVGCAVVASLALACGGEGAKTEGEEAAAGAEAAQAMPMIEGAATVSGTVRFTGQPPKARRIDMSEEEACAQKYPEGAYTQEIVTNADGTLRNVFIYVKGGLPAELNFRAPSEPVVLDQDGCRYEPHVFGIQAGQPLEIRNSDPLLHNIHPKPEKQRGFNISQPRQGMKTTKKFSQREVMVKVECDVHGWMNAYIGVLDHPYFDTSGDQGSFSLENLPPGTYEVEAWHERYGTQTQTVTVGAGETKTIEFTFNVAA